MTLDGPQSLKRQRESSRVALDEAERSAHRKLSRTHRFNGDPIVTLTVGRRPETAQFFIHKNLLCAASPVFEAAFNGNFRERNGAIELPGDSPLAFELLVQWLYSRRITFASQVMSHNQQKKLIGLYCLADKYAVMSLKKNLIGTLYTSVDQPDVRPPSRNLVKFAYENTAQGSRMRLLLVSWYAWIVDPEWYSEEGVSDWLPTVPDFAAELATSMALRLKGDPKQNPLNDPNNFREPLPRARTNRGTQNDTLST